MKLLKQIVHVIVLSSLLFPFGAQLSAYYNPRSVQNLSAIKPVVISVTVDHPAETIIPAVMTPVQAVSCQTPLAVNNGIILQGAALNLNEPASCFGLTKTVHLQTAGQLAVLPLVRPVVVIIPQMLKLSWGPILGAPTAPLDTTAPLVVFVSLGIIVFYEKKTLQRLAKNINYYKPALSLSQLQVLRC